MDIISSRVTNTGQCMTLTRIGELGGRKVRTTIHRDTYARQSYAKVETWTDAGWTNVIFVPGEHQLLTDLSEGYAAKRNMEQAEEWYEVLAVRLEDEALAVFA